MLARDDRFLPKLFDRMSIRGVPIYSILLVLVVTIVLVALDRSLATIIGIMVDGFLLSYALGAISLMVFRKTDPDTKRPFKLPFAHIFAPISFIIANILVYWSGFAAVEIIIPLDQGGLFLLIIYNHYNKIDGKLALYGIWMPAYLLFVLFMSYIGSGFFGGRNLIIFPHDSLLFIVVTAVFYFVGVALGIKSVEYQKNNNIDNF